MNRADWKKPQPQPTGPFSSNVQVFRFGSPGHLAAIPYYPTRQRVKKYFAKNPKLASRKVVLWNGQVYYWSLKNSYRTDTGKIPRSFLHWHIWQKQHRRPVPPAHTVIFLDGNHNNFSPSNLALRSRAQCAEQNHWKHRPLPERNRIYHRTLESRAVTIARRQRSGLRAALNDSMISKLKLPLAAPRRRGALARGGSPLC